MPEESIKSILMRRDGDSEAEAQDRIDEVTILIKQALARGEFWEIDEIIAEQLSLEPDYVEQLNLTSL